MKNKVALITGAGGGIGRAAALKLAESGMKLILFGGNNLEKLEETCKLVSQYTQCHIIPGNLTNLDFIAQKVPEAAAIYGSIDVLINNAGVAQSTPFENISVEEFDRIMTVNVKVPFFLTQQVIPYLKKSETPTIINIASVVAHAGYPLQSVYTASKHALLGMTKSIAAEYYQENIRVHAICPGGVYTDMVKVSRPDLTPDGMIMPEEIANIIHFFLANRGNAVVDEICVHRVNKTPFLI